MKKQCFVISPIGTEDSEIRKNANDVFEYVIKPAMDECNIEPFRSDHLDRPGRISDQMFHAIFNYDLCIADLTNYNPNVFYELAIAQAANRPVIILIKKGQVLPFDVADIRSVYYDLEIRPYLERTYIKSIVNHIKDYEGQDWKIKDMFSSFRPKALPENSGFELYDTAPEYGTDSDWMNTFRQTTKRFDIMGVGLSSWRKNSEFEQVALKKASEGCVIRILLMDPGNPALPDLTNTLKVMVVNIENNFQFFERLANQHENIKVRVITKGTLHLSLSITDQFALATLYMGSKDFGSGPLLKHMNSSPLYKISLEEFDWYWNASSEKQKIIQP